VRPRTKIAVILGTGCNAAYAEEVKSIGKIKDKGLDGNDVVAINCEWVWPIPLRLMQAIEPLLRRGHLTRISTNTFPEQNMT